MTEPQNPTSPGKEKPPVSDRQRAANRANAQKSTGPTSLPGKLACRANALKHTLNATVCVSNLESRDKFDDLTNAYRDFYQPANYLEEAYVTDLASIHWNRQRLQLIEHGLYEREIQNSAFQAKSANCSDPAKMVLAFSDLAEKGIFNTLNRTLSRTTREYNRVLAAFHEHRRNNPSAPAPVQPTELLGPVEPVQPDPSATTDLAQNEEAQAVIQNKNMKNRPIPETGHSPSVAVFAHAVTATRSVFNFAMSDPAQPVNPPGAPPPFAMIA